MSVHSSKPEKKSKFRKALDDARKTKREMNEESESLFYDPHRGSRFSKITSQVIAIIIFTGISLALAYSLFTSLTND